MVFLPDNSEECGFGPDSVHNSEHPHYYMAAMIDMIFCTIHSKFKEHEELTELSSDAMMQMLKETSDHVLLLAESVENKTDFDVYAEPSDKSIDQRTKYVKTIVNQLFE